ncbi:hypothetical protein [Kineococcus sp. NUM-3379]
MDMSNPDAVAQAALVALYSHDTSIDTGPHDAALRALPWLSSSFARAVQEARPVAAPGAEWNEWAQHQAWTTPRVIEALDQRPEDTSVQAFRQYQVDLTPTGRDGWAGAVTSYDVFVILTNDMQSGWRVNEVNLA